MADDMREADETDDDEATEREDNHNDSESWEGLSAENEEEEESLNQEEVVNEQEEKEKENMKEPEVQPRVPELIFQDGQWVQSSDAWSDSNKSKHWTWNKEYKHLRNILGKHTKNYALLIKVCIRHKT